MSAVPHALRQRPETPPTAAEEWWEQAHTPKGRIAAVQHCKVQQLCRSYDTVEALRKAVHNGRARRKHLIGPTHIALLKRVFKREALRHSETANGFHTSGNPAP